MIRVGQAGTLDPRERDMSDAEHGYCRRANSPKKATKKHENKDEVLSSLVVVPQEIRGALPRTQGPHGVLGGILTQGTQEAIGRGRRLIFQIADKPHFIH